MSVGRRFPCRHRPTATHGPAELRRPPAVLLDQLRYRTAALRKDRHVVTIAEEPPVLIKAGAPVLTVNDLDIDFWVDGTWYPAVVDAQFELMAGEVLSIVGESGSGKSTTAMAILGLLPKNSHVQGSIKLGDMELVG